MEATSENPQDRQLVYGEETHYRIASTLGEEARSAEISAEYDDDSSMIANFRSEIARFIDDYWASMSVVEGERMSIMKTLKSEIADHVEYRKALLDHKEDISTNIKTFISNIPELFEAFTYGQSGPTQGNEDVRIAAKEE